MQIMCYEQLLKMFFKNKQSQQDNFNYNQTIQHENANFSKRSTKLPMKPVYYNFRKCVDSDESCSSSNTCVETLESDPNSTYSCQNCRIINKSICNNSLHYADFRTFPKRYSDYLTPQQVCQSYLSSLLYSLWTSNIFMQNLYCPIPSTFCCGRRQPLCVVVSWWAFVINI